jgi:SPP1 family predicted phage head-tail adaptor
MRAGLLRKRVELQQVDNTGRDPTGGTDEDWTTIVTRWAELLPLRGQERYQAAQVEAQTTIKIRIRYYPPLDATWRIIYSGRIFNITGIVNIGERNFAQEIECKEVLE